MSNSTAFVGTQNVWQEWYELTTGLHGRLMADALIGLTTSTGLQQVAVTSGGNVHVELQPSTEAIGLLGASTAIIGYVKIDQTTPGASNAVTVTSTGGTVLFSTGNPAVVKFDQTSYAVNAVTPGALHNIGTAAGFDTDLAVLRCSNGQDLPLLSVPFVYNSTTLDAIRNNHSQAILASTSRTSNTPSADQVNYNAKAHILMISYDTSSGASITPTLQIKDSVSGAYATVWTGTVIVAGTTGLYTYLWDTAASTGTTGYTEVARVRPSRTWRLNVTHSSSGATQYSASISNLV